MSRENTRVEHSPVERHSVEQWAKAYKLFLRGRHFPTISRETGIPERTLKRRAKNEDWYKDRSEAWENLKRIAREGLGLHVRDGRAGFK
jgi:hypothetical protein